MSITKYSTKKLPYQFYAHGRTDHLENIKPRTFLRRETPRTLSEKPIVYQENEYQFRCDNPLTDTTNGPKYIALGCSRTYGIGVGESDTWSNILQSKMQNRTPKQPIKIFNMGVPGGSCETSYRILKNWIDIIRPRAVFLFTPPSWRREIIKENKIELVCEGHPLANKLKSVSSSESDDNHKDYMVKAIGHCCALYKAKLFVLDNGSTVRVDVGNDGVHPGPLSHKLFAKNFYSYWKREFKPRK